MAVQEALFHCTCTQPFSRTRPPPAEAPLAQYEHHALSDLLFCEDCDAIRCNQCAACEVACYYCPNCLFEVPSASVRGEKNRCARNCFQCPQCDHSLSVVASDPDPSIPLSSAAASVGEPPYLLSCNFCGWDSKQIGMTFEKPTGLALQLQKAEEPSADLLEYDHIKDHFDPFLRRSQAEASGSGGIPSTSTAGTGSVSARLFQDPVGLAARYGLSGVTVGGSNRARLAAAEARTGLDELSPYSSLSPSRGGGRQGSSRDARKGKEPRREEDHVEEEAELLAALREMTDWETVAGVDRRWNSSWKPPVLSKDLRPLRTPLQAKLSKRCPTCLHILIKPEQKSNSVRFKIKLVAANYLPQITVYRRPPASIGSRLSTIGTTASRRSRTGGSGFSSGDSQTTDDEPLRPGRTYTYELSFVNPLYEPIHVRLAVARPGAHKLLVEGETAPPPTFAAHLPTSTFPVAAYAEDWEFEDAEPEEDEMIAEEQAATGAGGGDGRTSPSKRSRKNGAGIVERRMNRTTVAMDVAVARDAVGPLKASMLVTYVYQADDEPAPPPSPTKSPQKSGSAPEVKSFSFWTLIPLGTVVPRATDSRRTGSGTAPS
ncbi:hypothetical protein C6P46_002673 [Rhodotorula mucilaginosa]|uniref:Dynactin subunit 4 n=1 Tax=Rhodotorula mucilaginosa TaxID=5537 RepID=A0A9P6W845_RHOMI|nr:hypothetical protein C6P46_002673 [Rhodotorula mucilaginosa]